jgi:hypothetical protein
MQDSTNFWLIAGAAAPIIALANVVTFGDASSLQHFFKYQVRSLTGDQARLDWAKHGRSRTWIVLILSYINLTLQGLVLFGALSHFINGIFAGKESLLLAAAIETYGIIVVLPATVFWTGSARNSQSQVESQNPIPRG